MDITAMAVRDAYRITPRRLPDRRGEFFEAVRREALEAVTGQPFVVRQVNYSVSRRHTLRGIHGTTLPPGQAKLVTCVSGAVLDVVVDLRAGSPTFGRFDVTRQDGESGISVYLADGLGHAFLALTDDVRMAYLCSEEYVPGTMVDIDALDPDLALPWPRGPEVIRSAKDAAAPRLADALHRLPTYEQCLAAYGRTPARDGGQR
ncbi:dTDP-4-dehydrorhamnose 3,5-epimerase family protein [Micromonospora tulbaghiae]|uniref:dTDP-4-dehydrorhamnose 3,5-epimerase family protein n=1 Tax=Micromonospora tulbaghiae TaxID=479978 RepID=A0AAW4JAC4_9ACTN|nr:dTDP-4-dehydrorhamnose 3,5-epimerase [Micromonospora tulbaghiae]MBO4139086.1 dTDP-4-dehydrorhamnose 3,5-epimerase family protein [Micromonospora tulbaghiae]